MPGKTLCLLVVLFVSTGVFAGSGTHWGYSGDDGPDYWAGLSPEYSACAGKNQSPINLTGFIDADLAPIKFHYYKDAVDIVNNGHTVQVNFDQRSNIDIDGATFNLLQYHFHAPSENRINGKSYPLEAHFVHSDRDGNLVVIALMFEEGAENKSLTKVWEHLPQREGDRLALPAVISAGELLPQQHDYYRYDGSLTTPPCTEGVRWLVMKEPVSASKKQIEALVRVMPHPNNRPVQPANAREVLK